jgi:hypothetical protein
MTIIEKYGELDNPQITTERLSFLYTEYQHEKHAEDGEEVIVLPKIARHPNTPPSILEDLLGYFPDDVLSNPALPLLIIENPFFFHHQTTFDLLKILADPNLPKYVLYSLKSISKKPIQAAIHHHVGFGEAEENWEQEVSKEIMQFVIVYVEKKHLSDCGFLPEWIEKRLHKLNPSKPWKCPAPNFKPLSEKQQTEILALSQQEIEQLAKNTNSIAALEFLASLKNEYMLHYVAYNRFTPPSILEELSQHSEYWRSLAMNPMLPEHLFYKIAEEKRYFHTLAENPGTPTEILRHYFTFAHTEPHLARQLVNHPNTPEEIWEKLAPQVSSHSIHIPERVSLERLIQDYRNSGKAHYSNREAGKALLQREDASLPLKREIITRDYSVLETPLARFIAINQATNLTQPTLEIAKEGAKNWWIRFAIVTSPNAEQDYWGGFENDADRYVRAAARARLENPNWRFEP